MKKKSSRYSAFFEPRIFIAFLLLFGGTLLAIGGIGTAAENKATNDQVTSAVTTPESGRPDVVQMVGPFSEDRDLRDIPYAAPNMEVEEVRLMRHPLPMVPSTEPSDPYQEVKKVLAATIAMPT